jgi:hypothetical protein
MQAFVGTMIKKQPLYIKGIDDSNQHVTKTSAFGAMGMFIFLFTASAVYICFYKHRDSEHHLRSQGYMRPIQRSGSRGYHVELPHSPSIELQQESDGGAVGEDEEEHDGDEMSHILS